MITIGDLLKSETVIELLELYDIDVIYDFDRLNEGEEDSYTASNDELGLEMKFNKDQILSVIWIKISNSVNAKEWVHWESFSSIVDVEVWAKKHNYEVKIGDNWIRADGKTVCYHYAFDLNILSMVTLMSKNIAP